jgi:hypothetical protein
MKKNILNSKIIQQNMCQSCQVGTMVAWQWYLIMVASSHLCFFGALCLILDPGGRFCRFSRIQNCAAACIDTLRKGKESGGQCQSNHPEHKTPSPAFA